MGEPRTGPAAGRTVAEAGTEAARPVAGPGFTGNCRRGVGRGSGTPPFHANGGGEGGLAAPPPPSLPFWTSGEMPQKLRVGFKPELRGLWRDPPWRGHCFIFNSDLFILNSEGCEIRQTPWSVGMLNVELMFHRRLENLPKRSNSRPTFWGYKPLKADGMGYWRPHSLLCSV